MKKRMNLRVLSFILAMITVFVSTSFTAIAEDATVNQNESITDITEEVSFADPDEFIPAVYEVEDLREESVKHFSMPDGTYQAVSYSGAVHRKNADGTWRDIDNRLNAVTKNGFASYTTEDGRISFVQNTQSVDGGSMLYTLTEGNYMIAMGIMGTSPSGNIMADDNAVLVSAGEVTNHAPRPEILVTDSAEEQLSKLRDIDNTTEILYEDILNDTDIEYVLMGNDVKENIIVKAKRDNYTYTFQMLVKGLTATENADGSITLSDETSGEAVYYIPAPYMYDANGDVSYDVAYTLTEVFPEIYTLAGTADETWIETEDRAFPVVIDPFIASTTKAKDTTIVSNIVNTNYGNLSRLPVKENMTALVQVNLPSLPYGSKYNNIAHLCLSYYFLAENAGYATVDAYKMTGTWGETTANYSNANALIDEAVLSTETLEWYSGISSSDPGFASFNISDAVLEWYSDTSNGWQQSYGFAVKYNAEESTASNIIFASSECGDSEFTPFISVSYTTTIADGVYSLQNMGTMTYTTIDDTSVFPGSTVVQADLTANPASTFNRQGLFKITNVAGTGRFVIRSMINNKHTISMTADGMVTKEIPSSDSEVALEDTYYIEYGLDGFEFRPAGTPSQALSVDFSTLELTTVPETNIGMCESWMITKYSGAVRFDVDICESIETLIVGTSTVLTPYSWSTIPNANYPAMGVTIQSDDPDNPMADWWWSNLNYLYVCPFQSGTIVFFMKISSDEIQHHSKQKQMLILPFEDGIYNLSCNGNYLTFEKNNNEVAIVSDDNLVSISSAGYGNFLWSFKHISNGYYRITSSALRDESTMTDIMSLSAVSSNDLDLLQYSGAYSQQWFIKSNGESLTISNRLYGSKFLVADDSDWLLSTSQLQLEIEALDTWNLYYVNTYTRGIDDNGELHIKVSIDSSALVDGIITSETYDIIQYWEEFCDQIHIYMPGESCPTNVFEVKIIGNALGSGTMGRASLLMDGVGVDLYDDANEALIEINTDLNGALLSDENTSSNIERSVLINKVILHEFGHALKLKHPMYRFHDNNTVVSVMNQKSPYEDNSYVIIYPGDLDFYSLKQKWGW